MAHLNRRCRVTDVCFNTFGTSILLWIVFTPGRIVSFMELSFSTSQGNREYGYILTSAEPFMICDRVYTMVDYINKE